MSKIIVRLLFCVALAAAADCPLAIAGAKNTTTPYLAAAACTLNNPTPPTATCLTDFTVPTGRTLQIEFVSFNCTSNFDAPFIGNIQFQTNNVVGQFSFNPRQSIYNGPGGTPYVTAGAVSPLSIYADAGSTVTVNLFFSVSPADQTTCNLTLGGVT